MAMLPVMNIFQGDTYKGHTLIPFLEKITTRFELGKPVAVADAGLLSNDNLKTLQAEGYQYILGARIKNEAKQIKEHILQQEWEEGKAIRLSRKDDTKILSSSWLIRKKEPVRTSTIGKEDSTDWKNK